MENIAGSIMESVAILLGVELLEEFTIKASDYGKILGCNVDEEIVYRFDSELVRKGYNDGWSEWYGRNQDIFYKLCIGLYETVKIESENTSCN